MRVRITDDGIPFNRLKNDPPNVTAPLRDRAVGGLGIHLIRNMMDEVSYERHANNNVVTFAKLQVVNHRRKIRRNAT